MPRQQVIRKARQDKRAGKSASTQAGEFVKDEIDKIRKGKHGARSTRQAVAIGLSEARRAGVDLPPPRKGRVKKATRRSAKYAYEVGQGKRTPKRRPRVSRGRRGGFEKGAALDRIAQCIVEAGQACRGPANGCVAFGRGAQGEPHQGRQRPLSRRKEGGTHQGAPPELSLVSLRNPASTSRRCRTR
ncbi:hypothetical protein ACVWWG_003652 [Bradyrhizobium sp. LB7.2]